MKKIKDLSGLSAGKICYTNFDKHDGILKATLQAAENLGASSRSKWTLSEVWVDGTTLWKSPTESQQALVSTDGLINILFIPDNNEW